MSKSKFVPVGAEFTFAGQALTAIRGRGRTFCVFHSSGHCLRPDLENVNLSCTVARPDGVGVFYVYSDLLAAIRRSLQ